MPLLRRKKRATKKTAKRATKKTTKRATKKKAARKSPRRRAMEVNPGFSERYEDEFIGTLKYRDVKPKPLTGAAKDAAEALTSTADEAEDAISKFLDTLTLNARGGRKPPSKASVLALFRLAQDYPSYQKRLLPKIRAFRKSSDDLLNEIGDMIMDLERGSISRDSIGRGLTKADTRKEYESTLLGGGGRLRAKMRRRK